MAAGDYYLQKNNGASFDEKIFTAVSGRVLGFDAGLNPVLLDVSLATHTHSYLPLAGGTMANTTVVTNMNADLLDGQHGSYYVDKATKQTSILGIKGFGGETMGGLSHTSTLATMGTSLRGLKILSINQNLLSNLDLKTGYTISAPNTSTFTGTISSLFDGNTNSGILILTSVISDSTPFILEVTGPAGFMSYAYFGSWFNFIEVEGWTPAFNIGNSAFTSWKVEMKSAQDGLWYTLIDRTGVVDKVNNLNLSGFTGSSAFFLAGGRTASGFRLTVRAGNPYVVGTYPQIYLSGIAYYSDGAVTEAGNFISERGGTIYGGLTVNGTTLLNAVSKNGTAVVTNFNADLLDGQHGSYYAAASTVHNPVTIGTANGLSLSTQALSLAAASSTLTGALTSTDWNTFNNKVSFPGFGTTGTTAAYGNHSHTGYVPYTGAIANVNLGTNSLTAFSEYDTALKGTSTYNHGVSGYSNSEYGVYGESITSFGVKGIGYYAGVFGEGDGAGVRGGSANGIGVEGFSTFGTGVKGSASEAGHGVEGLSAGFGFYGIVGNSAKFGSDTDYSMFDDYGQLSFIGEATVFDDIQFAISTGKVPAANAPTWSAFGANTSLYSFAVNDYIDLEAQEFLHSWEEGSTVEFHIHWATGTGNYVSGDRVQWKIYYSWANMSSTAPYSNFTTEYEASVEHVFSSTVTPRSHVYSSFGAFTPTGGTIGAQLVVRLKRIAKKAGTDPSTAPFVLQVGMHYKIDTIGSQTQTGKWLVPKNAIRTTSGIPVTTKTGKYITNVDNTVP